MIIFALSALQGLAFYMLSGYLVTYLIETIGLDSTTALLSDMVALGFLTVAIPLGGILGDRIGREPMMFAYRVPLLREDERHPDGSAPEATAGRLS